MINEAEEYKSAEDLRREIADLKIRLAFQEEFEAEVEDILEACEQPDPELLKVIREEEKGLLREISQHYRKERFNLKKFAHSTAARIAATIIVCMFICVSSAMATIYMVRTGIFALHIRGDHHRISVRMVQTGTADVPEGWDGYYYPTYIPEGFEFDEIYGGTAKYFAPNGDWLIFVENSHGERTSIDTENAKISHLQINGMEATIIEKNGKSTVLWSIGNRYFVVKVSGMNEIAIRIAASVIMIR